MSYLHALKHTHTRTHTHTHNVSASLSHLPSHLCWYQRLTLTHMHSHRHTHALSQLDSWPVPLKLSYFRADVQTHTYNLKKTNSTHAWIQYCMHIHTFAVTLVHIAPIALHSPTCSLACTHSCTLSCSYLQWHACKHTITITEAQPQNETDSYIDDDTHIHTCS